MLRRRRKIVAGFGAVGVAMATSSWAWACTPQAKVFDMSTAAAPSGAEVRVSGTANPGRLVEIRWNGAGGAKVAAATAAADGAFAAVGTVPDVEPGAYFLAMVSGNDPVGRAAFEVTPASGVSQAAQVPAGTWEPSHRELAEPASSSRAQAGGMILLGLGSVALFAGLVVAVVRRRSTVTA